MSIARMESAPRGMRILSTMLGLVLGAVIAGNTWAAPDESMEDLRAEVQALRLRLAEIETRLETRGGENNSRSGPEISVGGQYRINSYTADNDQGEDNQTASRVRIRQNLDLRFNEQLKTHLQFELGHTNHNRITTDEKIAVRHALIDYTLGNNTNFQAGIVPLSDHFGDTLFSADWDYNPLALSATVPLWGGSLRAFAGNLWEGDESNHDDDFVHYQLDYGIPLSEDSQLNLGASFATIEDINGESSPHINYGIGSAHRLRDDLILRGFVMGSHTDRSLLGTRNDADGIAAKIELISDSGFALMVTTASGDSDGSGFLPIMALASTYGYWGYTGLLTVQGPTDTGFDGDAVNVSNNGFGLTTVQARYARRLTSSFGIHLAAGWFGNTDGPSGRDSTVGLDFLAMGTYRFNEILALDFGGAYARLGDSVSGYSNGVIGGASFNQPLDKDRDKYAFFTRLQAEF